MTTQPHGPLQGVKVVSCSTAQAGTVPYMLMADLGAEVIKIETPNGGDNSRTMSILPGLPSSFFETNNRGVKSVTLNLKSAEGQAILKKLVARADIFGQNFRPGAAEKNGFGYEDLRKVNPRLVYMSISGYGPNVKQVNVNTTWTKDNVYILTDKVFVTDVRPQLVVLDILTPRVELEHVAGKQSELLAALAKEGAAGGRTHR